MNTLGLKTLPTTGPSLAKCFAGLTFLLGMLLSSGLGYLLKHKNEAAAQSAFDQVTKSTLNDILENAQSLESRLRLIAVMHQTLHSGKSIDNKVFESYAEVLYNSRQFHGLLALDFVERVPRNDLKRIEAQHHNKINTNLNINTSGNDDGYVVKYIEPLTPNRAALGLDAAAIATVRANMERAISTNSATLSTRFSLEQNNEMIAGYIFTLPIFRAPVISLSTSARKEELIGFFDTFLTPEGVFKSLNNSNYGQLEFQVLEVEVNQAKKVVFSQLTAIESSTFTAQAVPFETNSNYHAEKQFSIGGRPFLLRSGSTAIFEKQHASFNPYILAIAGFIFSALAALSSFKFFKKQEVTQAVIGKLPGMVAFWGTNLRCQFSNDGYLEYFGRTRGEMQNIHIQELMGTTLFAQNVGHINSVLQGIDQSFERQITKHNGEVAHTLTRYICVKEGEQLQGFIAYITDITVVKQNEKVALFNHVALNTISQGIVVANSRNAVQYVNPAFTRITGYSLEDVVGRSTKILQGLHTEPAAIEKVNNHIASGTTLTQPILNYRKDGTTFWNEMSVSPVYDSNGEIIKYVGVINDITQRVESEQKLAQALTTAQSAVQSKTMFLANTSHEMRTPLHGMLGMLQLLQKTTLTEIQKEYAHAINTAAKTLLEQIDQLLDLSKLEAKKLIINPQPMKLQAIKTDTMEWLPILTNNKPVHISFEIDSSISTTLFLADANRLQQIITNLSSNAIRFTHRGEVRISIEPKERTNEYCTLQFSVRDTGMGIADSDIQRIFSNFEQADTSTTRLHGGTGLGLPISKQLVELMGGHLEVESQVHIGSHFYFILNLPFANPITSITTPSPISVEHTDTLHNIKILVAEDNSINQKVARMLLESEGAEVAIVENGKLAVNAVAEASNKFDVVLMDLQMPVMDGYAATQAIRQDLCLHELPIIAMTASAMITDRESCIRAGMNGHISKPFNSEQLVSGILKQLKKKQNNTTT